MKNKAPYVSIIVCSYNGEASLAECLKAIRKQRLSDQIEIIVVDDGSTDATATIARSFAGVKVISNERNLGLAASRNVGIRAARGSIIAFTDDDCRPYRDWIKQLLAVYEREPALGVGGVLVSKDTSNLMQRYLHHNNPLQPLEYSLFTTKSIIRRFVDYIRASVTTEQPSRVERPVYSFVGGNMSFRKELVIEAGMFDENFTFGAEDQEMCRRINKLHPKSLYLAPRSVVKHQFVGSLKDTLRRSAAYAIGNARLAHKEGDLSPTVYPFPVIIGLSLLFGLLNPWLLLTPFVLTQLAYPKGILVAVKQRSLEPLLYGYIQGLQELSNNIGYVRGWWRARFTSTAPELPVVPAETVVQETPVAAEVEALVATSTKPYKSAAIILALLGAALLSNLVHATTIFHIPVAITLILLSGYLVFRGFRGYERAHVGLMLRLGLQTALGIAWLMLFGLVMDVLLPVFGVKQPLTSSWLFSLFPLATAALVPWSVRAPGGLPAKLHKPVFWDSGVLLVLLSLTIAFCFVGARLLNNGYTNVPAMLAFVFGFAAIIFCVARQKRLPTYAFPATLFVISLAGVWSYSLRSNYVFGFDIQQEFQVFQTTLSAGVWKLGAHHNPYDAMLSLTVFPVILSKLSSISGLTIFKVIAPMLFSFVPVFLYYIYRLVVRPWIAFIAALVVVAQFYYMQQFSGEVRQQIAFLFFAAALYLILQKEVLSRRARSLMLTSALLGLVVSHYSTTYLAIIFFLGAYIAMKLCLRVFGRHDNRKVLARHAYIKGWMVLVLCVATALWYGPATHSYGNLQSFNKTTSYSSMIATIKKDVSSLTLPSEQSPPTTQIYLQDISKYYHNNVTYFDYYPGATDSSVSSVSVPTIQAHSALLKTLANAVNVVISFGWWILGTIGIIAGLLWAYRHREFTDLEVGLMGVMGLLAFVAIHVIPSLQVVYNPSRLNEQVLMVVGLPAVLVAIWFFECFLKRGVRYIMALGIAGAYLLAAGIVTQFTGGIPTANLNNYGADYDSLYVQQTDIAAAQWLGTQYTANDVVFADDFANNRLEAASDIDHGQLTDVTPETIAEGSYVFADYTNVKGGYATSSISGTNYTYTFPAVFLEQHKAVVYTNGDAKVYK